ncbi:MAG: glycosyltransferase family 4 protein [Acidobacteria bacterium]|jgi:glycosyltransferase involved in cell wall biosynthesis|nr:glycosyltransferase family 4 protein [Acidobacteriota bacterium]
MPKIKIACIGNYVPRQCGIATFTRDLVEGITQSTIGTAEAFVVAMNDGPQTYNYPEIVSFTIRQDHLSDYLNAVKYINFMGADVCILEHEFGIYGGDDGVFILSLIHRLNIPLVVTLHTVLKNPSYNQKIIIQEITKKAEKVVVMSILATQFLKDAYGIPQEKIVLIEHGVPDFNHMKRKKYKRMLNLENKKSLFTFGLLCRDKGIETVIKALPRVVAKHPEILYIILGKTHPVVVRVSDEEYRKYLKTLVEKNNLSEHVCFYDRFVANEELFGYLHAIDVYITPYLNKTQITSGTLAYAVGAGAAVLSTPYWHAEELLANGMGKLFNFNDSDQLAEILIDLFDNPNKLEQFRKKAYKFGRNTTWPRIGARYLELVSKSIKSFKKADVKKDSIIQPTLLPGFSLDHVKRLTDKTGILQHTKFGIPNFKEGYCLDDNAMALLMATMAYRQTKSAEMSKLIPIYLSFIHYMQNKDGTLRNFLSYSRQYIEEQGSHDSFGKAAWALGYLLRFPPHDTSRQLAKDLFFKIYPHFEKLTSPRAIAYIIIGMCHYLHRFPGDETVKKTMKQMTEKLVNQYEIEKDGDWHWFEENLTYANGILPLALLHSLEIIPDEKTYNIAMESMDFLEHELLREGYLSLVGNENWYAKGSDPSRFAQQPVDAMAMVLMAYQAWRITKKQFYLGMMSQYFQWFLGENELGMPMYNFDTGGCFDGLENHGLNPNQGAESTLSYMVSHLTILMAHDAEQKLKKTFEQININQGTNMN